MLNCDHADDRMTLGATRRFACSLVPEKADFADCPCNIVQNRSEQGSAGGDRFAPDCPNLENADVNGVMGWRASRIAPLRSVSRGG